jgi:hypothetical protein
MEYYIRIESEGENQTKVEIHGNGGKLMEMVASAIVNDINFGMIILGAISKVAEDRDKLFKDINLN